MDHLSVQVVLDGDVYSSHRCPELLESLANLITPFAAERKLLIELGVRCSNPQTEVVVAHVTIRVEFPSGRNALVLRDDIVSLVRQVIQVPASIKAVAIPVHTVYHTE